MTTRKATARRTGLDGEPAWRLAVRCASALLGAYAAASGLSTLLARLAPIARVEAAAWGQVVSFALFAVLGLWAFAEPRLARAAGVIWGLAALSIAATLALGVRP